MGNCFGIFNKCAKLRRSESTDNRPISPELEEILKGHESILDMLNLISDLQSDRMNNQRAELHPLQPEDSKGASLPGQNASATTRLKPEDDFLDIIARVQGSRLEDQRTELPLLQPEPQPSVSQAPAAPAAPAEVPASAPQGQAEAQASSETNNQLDEQDEFLTQLMRAQSSRLEDQRATIGGAPKKN